jgi:hypothetical protein
LYLFITPTFTYQPVPVTAQKSYKKHSIEGSNPAGGLDACLSKCCVLSGRGTCDGIPRLDRVCVCVCFIVIRCYSYPLHLQRVGRRSQIKEERKKERKKERTKELMNSVDETNSVYIVHQH